MSRTLAGRAAWAVALATLAGALLTAALTHALAWRGALAREDVRLGAATATLAAELTGARDAAEADEEDREVMPGGMRVSLWQGGRFIGGAVGLRAGSTGCGETAWQGSRWRRCTVSHGSRTIVAASPYAPLVAARDAWLLASAVAVALASLVAAAAGRALARRVVGPLARLRSSVAAVRADTPDPSALPPPEGYEEIDALRGALAELLSRHEASLLRARRFAADAAHELRTPIATLRAGLELAREEPGLPTAHAAGLERLGETARAMGTLAERLLILASPLTSQAVLVADVSMAEVIADARDARDARVQTRVELDLGGEGMVRGEPTLLRVLVENALENALKFAPEGAVHIALREERDEVVMRVRDEGPGVPGDLRALVFEPFHRTATARAAGVGGHGVGLALIAQVAQAHGGDACFEDVPRGASLRVRLPRWRADGRR